jgi:acetyltransferase
LVNPNYDFLAGQKCYPDTASLPGVPDLAVIATPPETIPAITGDLARKGARAAVVITAGFGEGGDEKGKRLCSEMLDAAKPGLLRIVGPNCLGIMTPGIGLNASMAHIVRPIPGSIAFVAQSGAVQTSVLDWAISRGIGFSYFVSLGDMGDVDFGDMLDYLANDFRTRAILLYMETVTHARKFMSAARAAARVKPVIVLKAGRYKEGAMAAARHTGAVAGDDAVCDAAFRRAGMLRVYQMQALFDAVETLAMSPRSISGNKLAILTNGGGVGVIATDALIQRGGRLAELSSRTIERLDATLPTAWSRSNPIDIMSDAPAERYAKALEIILDNEELDAVLVLNCPIAVVSGADAAMAVIGAYKGRQIGPKGPVLLTCWLGEQASSEARRLFSQHRIRTYKTPTDAVRAFMHMVNYQRNQELLMETPASIPESFSPDLESALRVIEDALAADCRWLSASESQSILAAYRIPVILPPDALTPEEPESLVVEFERMTTLHFSSSSIGRKDAGGGFGSRLEVTDTLRKTDQTISEYIDGNRLEQIFLGHSAQRISRASNIHELMIGVVNDEQFGPVVTFGHGGEYAHDVDDKALALPPLNMHLAHELMSRTRIYKLLKGRGPIPPVDLDALALTLVKVSQMICDIAEIESIEINPLLADASGVVALDARIGIARSSIPASERLAIRPYPKELEDSITLADGRVLQVRPIRPEDEHGFLDIVESLTPEARRMRFLYPLQVLSHNQAARLTQIDYEREMALVLASSGGLEGAQELYGSVRIIADPDSERAEYAILVRSDFAGKGLGRKLMQRIIDYARSRGIKEIFGQVLSDNTPMLKVCRALGFTTKIDLDDPGVIIVSLKL